MPIAQTLYERMPLPIVRPTLEPIYKMCCLSTHAHTVANNYSQQDIPMSVGIAGDRVFQKDYLRLSAGLFRIFTEIKRIPTEARGSAWE